MKLTDWVAALKESVEPGVSLTRTSDDVKTIAEESAGKWLGKRMSDNSVYLFHDKKWLNLTSLKAEMDQLYASKGHSNEGYDRLVEDELMCYKTVKDIFLTLLTRSISAELDPKSAAAYIYDREIF